MTCFQLCCFFLSLPLLGLGSMSTSLNPELCVCWLRQYDIICWEFDLFSGFFVSPEMIVWVDEINRSAPDPKCELNITFLTLPHPLHCLICIKDIMIIVLLLHVIGGGGDGMVEGNGSFMLGCGWGTGGGYHIF